MTVGLALRANPQAPFERTSVANHRNSTAGKNRTCTEHGDCLTCSARGSPIGKGLKLARNVRGDEKPSDLLRNVTSHIRTFLAPLRRSIGIPQGAWQREIVVVC